MRCVDSIYSRYSRSFPDTCTTESVHLLILRVPHGLQPAVQAFLTQRRGHQRVGKSRGTGREGLPSNPFPFPQRSSGRYWQLPSSRSSATAYFEQHLIFA